MEDPLIIILTIIFSSIVQSLLGVGVLLFGTPILLLLNFEYFQVLNVLLPVSLLINIFQFKRRTSIIDKNLAKDFIILVLPLVALSLTVAAYVDLDFTLLVGLFLIFISISKVLKLNLNALLHGKIYLLAMAVIHGLTNLGGSLLVGYISLKGWDKIKTRTNIAFCYFSFALTQLVTLKINGKLIFDIYILIYAPLGLFIFYVTNKFVFTKIVESSFSRLISLLLFVFGIILLFNFMLY
jgi:hypothetical protein